MEGRVLGRDYSEEWNTGREYCEGSSEGSKDEIEEESVGQE